MLNRAFITGGSSGIGRAIAIKLAEQGASVYIIGRNEKNLQLVVNEINTKGGSGYYKIADVTKRDAMDKAFDDAVTSMGSVDIVVANAGVGRFNTFEEFTDDDYDVQFDTNVKGVFYVLRSALKHMKKQDRGQIIVTSSNLGFNTAARCGLYAATKFAVQAMVGAIREEIKGTGVKAATLNPGSVDTPWFDGRDVDRSKMLSSDDVATAALLVINQSKTSDVDHILLMPGRTKPKL